MLPEIVQLAPDFWQIYRDLRLEALATDPHAFAVTHQKELATTEAQWRAFIGNMWFAKMDEEVVGMIGLLHNPALPCKHRASVISFWVKPSHRGQGIGTALVRHMQDVARSRGYRKLDLNVAITQGAAIALYEKLGFQRVGVLHDHVQFDGIFLDSVVMEWLALEATMPNVAL